MNIIKSDLGPLLLQVGIPFVIFIGAGFAVVAGYKNLENQLQTREELAQRAEEINQAFDSITELKGVLVSQKNELSKQILTTEKINDELKSQKEFNQNIREISLLSLKVKNGSRKAYEKLMELQDKLSSDENYQEYFSQETRNFHALWGEEAEKENLLVYQIIETSERKKWSAEYLYCELANWNPIRQKKDELAILNEIVQGNHNYFVNKLYKIATEDNDIYTSINAGKALCLLVKFEPYDSKGASFAHPPLVQFKSDIINFRKLTLWWNQTGSKKLEYNCPFDKVKNSAGIDRFKFDCKSTEETISRIEELELLTKQFPRLARTKAELGYLILDDRSTFDKVSKLANEALEETNMETLPYLLLAYIAYVNNNKIVNSEFENNIILAYEAYNFDQIFRTLQLNKKFDLMFYDAQIVLDNYLETKKEENK